MDEKAARSIAKDFVQKMLDPIFSGPKAAKYPPLTIVELIYIGAYFTCSMVQFGFDPRDDEVYSVFKTFPPDAARLEDILCERILAGKEIPDEILEAIKAANQLAESPGSYRHMMIEMMKDVVPGGKPGRRAKIKHTDLPRLAALSDQLLPAVRTFLTVRKQSAKRSNTDILQFLAADFEKQAAYLLPHRQAFDQLLQDKKLLRTAKAPASQARLIADAMAGGAFDLQPSYAIRKAKEARRMVKRGINTAKVQN